MLADELIFSFSLVGQKSFSVQVRNERTDKKSIAIKSLALLLVPNKNPVTFKKH